MMGPAELLIIAGIIYVFVDLVTMVIFKRCVLPGLKCPACRVGRKCRHEYHEH